MRPDERPTVDATVVICAYTEERWDDLRAAIASVAAQTVRPRETLVVVDHNPGLLARLADVDGIRAVANDREQGLSGARNTAVDLAVGGLVVFLDDDATAEGDWLARLVGAFDDDPAVVAVGGAAEPRWDEGRPDWFPAEFDWVVGCTYRGTPVTRAEIRNPLGCNMAFRRTALAALEPAGGFRTDMGRVAKNAAGCEETELCIRLRQQRPGARIVSEPGAAVHHRVPGNRGTWTYFRRRCYAEGRSKAAVARHVGAADGLSTERSYVARTLPLGVKAGVVASLCSGNLDGLRRAAAIVAGLAFTGAGYARGSLAALAPAARPDGVG